MPLDPVTLTSSAFPDATEARWREAVAKVLKGGAFDRLRTPTLDGITIEPLYASARTATAITPARGAAPWVVMQRIDHPDINEANALALADLSGGASGLDLVFASSPNARGYGLTARTESEIATLLDRVLLDLISIRVDAGDDSAAIAHLITDHAARQGVPSNRLDLTVCLDPIGAAAARGGSERPLAALVDDACEQANILANIGFPGPLLQVDGRVWHEAGASRVETLGAMLATAIAYWRALERAGMAVEEAAARIGFTLPIDQNQFSEMAEIRGFRLLWARAMEAAGLPPAKARIHAETAYRMMSRLDANTNVIRTTIAAFAAGVGGADSVTVLPLSAANGLPDAFARRLARNMQLILLEESNLYRVADPAAGAGRIEAETRAIAGSAWALFQAIEAEGGIVASLQAGTLQARIAATAAARAKDFARRKEVITGVSAYPLLGEEAVHVLDVAPGPAPPAKPLHAIEPLESKRFSEAFETLRGPAVSAALHVFLANLGTPADYNPRSTWVNNLCAVGGIAAIDTGGYERLDDLVAAFKSSAANAVCLVSSDPIYATEALAAVAALKAAGAGPIFFAGKPGEGFQEDSLRDVGVNGFLHAGQDVIVVLGEARALIGRATRAPH